MVCQLVKMFNRKQFVAYDGTNSETLTVVSMVPQGSILGPLLFLLLINDIEHTLEKCEILLYAGDTVLFTANKRHETIERDLNQDTSAVSTWSKENRLVANLNKGKTEFVLYDTP